MENQPDRTAERTAKDKERFLDELSKTPNVEVTCKKVGVSRATYYRWRNEDQTFYEDAEANLKLSRNAMNDLVEWKLLDNVKKGQQPAITYYLSHNHQTYKSKYTFQEQFAIEIERSRQFRSEMMGLQATNKDLSEQVRWLQYRERERKKEEDQKKEAEEKRKKEMADIEKSRTARKNAAPPTPNPIVVPKPIVREKKPEPPIPLLLPAPKIEEKPRNPEITRALDDLFKA
jgi:hypothetical protein